MLLMFLILPIFLLLLLGNLLDLTNNAATVTGADLAAVANVADASDVC